MNVSTLKEIANIAIRLTITCLLAGIVMGAAYVLTHDAKEANEQAHDSRVMFSLLGFSTSNPAPETLAIQKISRYIVTHETAQNTETSMAYAVPLQSGSYTLIELDLSGSFIRQTPISADADTLINAPKRDEIIFKTMKNADPQAHVRFADSISIVTDKGKRIAYILDGRYPGFKTHIKVKIALDPQYTTIGFEVLEHEEDPGLGAEIEKPWFKHQFDSIPLETLRKINVKKEPLPEDYKAAMLSDTHTPQVQNIIKQHANDDIYAITGATISSRSVLSGNKALITKFAYRMDTLDKAIHAQNIPVAF